ncbi:hypothetical protein J2Y67_004653 [Neobacillus niacini]|nr:hypothetical protein [Neobacillus niacini]
MIGVTRIFWPATYPWNTDRERQQVWMDICSYPVPVRFLRNGPLGAGARTYFGGHILDMFGKEFLLYAAYFTKFLRKIEENDNYDLVCL